MSESTWLDVVARVVPVAPVDLDSILDDRPETPMAPTLQAIGRSPSAKLWDRTDSEQGYIGVRIKERTEAHTEIAVRLAAAAVERHVVPVILSHVPDCGFERFGFRVEFVGGATKAERESAEDELRHFWDMAIVIDLGEVVDLK